MNNLRDKKSNPVITLIVVVISLFLLPAIVAGLGTMGVIYIDGLRELPSFCIKAISVAIWMLVVAYLMCRIRGLRVNRTFSYGWPSNPTTHAVTGRGKI